MVTSNPPRTTAMLIFSLLFMGMVPQQAPTNAPSTGTTEAGLARGFVVSRSGPPLVLPRDEQLTYDVHIEFGPFGGKAGTVIQTSKVDTFRQSILLQEDKEDESQPEAAHVQLHAKGSYSLYTMDTLIETRILPQEWPRVTYRVINRGTEKRRREIKLGMKAGEHCASYRKDTSHGAPRGTRIWRESLSREIPADTVDMLSSIFLARTLVEDGLEEVSFPLIDKLSIWDVTLVRGGEQRMKLPAGTFDAVEVAIRPQYYPGEEVDPKKREKFEGLFGMRGEMHLWVDKRTGVPVRIQGELPVGPLTLGIDVRLRAYRGTPKGFRPVSG